MVGNQLFDQLADRGQAPRRSNFQADQEVIADVDGQAGCAFGGQGARLLGPAALLRFVQGVVLRSASSAPHYTQTAQALKTAGASGVP